ncbi:MAG: hypothetical protein V4719_15425 [Planctomycetota bacterium]
MALQFSKCVASCLSAILLCGSGCHRDAALLQGGTAGTIELRGVKRADMQLNVFEDAPSPRRLAYGVSGAQGHFSLIADDGLEPATLPPGKYRLTLESVAADPIPIPAGYRDVKTTSLKIDWPSDDGQLNVNVH